MIISSREQYLDFIEKVKKEPLIGLDLETEEFSDSKTHAFELALDGVGVYSESASAYIPVKWLEPNFQEVLDGPELVIHNAKFDLTVLNFSGFDISKVRFHDTYIMSWLCDENRESHRLKDLAKRLLKVPASKIQEFKDVKKRPKLEEYGMFPFEFDKDLEAWEKELGMYCINDCKYTYKLFKIFKPILEEEGIWSDYEKVELPMIRVLMDMENTGIALDENYLKEMKEKVELLLNSLRAEIWGMVGYEFDINSPKQLSKVLFQDKGYVLTDEHRTAKGAFSTGEASLVYLGAKYPEDNFVGKLLEYRDLFKLQSAFIDGLLAKSKSGVIHASFIQAGTKTGRFSCQAPNLQQISRRDDEFDIRKAFVARDGYIFIDSDLNQVELRVAAYYSKDPTLIEAFRSGEDVHTATAKALGCERVVAKCFAGGTLILTDNGPVKIEYLCPKVNDGEHTEFDKDVLSLDYKGTKNKILSTFYEEGVKDWVEFELGNGDSFEVTLDHRMIVLRDGETIEIRAGEVVETDFFISIE